ncbi:DUF4138 domain-containing protein [Christiangramia sp. OXR-203]|uniref:DUF4138 domain-containing protein n=1 Tax=Christiangramia sp. OXR-203 TaxID=3100176 RepID=UPI002AC99A7E|nr:DUF4138 domain-containing protein [Christiangramia sp. OXR-203]WPY98362.1 DUF4138 domain-containing protein [Christiangramia sp. OXR-203]
MKSHIPITVLMFLIVFGEANAQQPVTLDTIYANDTKNVALFFPQPIRQGITGSDNFVFTFNREKEQHLGLLQAKPGKESNLLVINRDGSIFSYIVKYKAEISKLNYFIEEASSIGNENRAAEDETAVTDIPKAPLSRRQYYERFCSYLLNNQKRVALKQKRKEGVVLNLENIAFEKEELYFVIQIENNSSLDYDLNFLNLFVETRQKGKSKSLQRIYKETLHKHQLPSKIKEGTNSRLVYVMPKFSISDERRVILELNEKNGERNIKLKIPHRMINNPN